MDSPQQSAFPLTDIERQRRAFAYLRDEARAAHSDGDGILVQHLATIAIRELIDLAKGDRLLLGLQDFYWAPVFSLYWLVRDYSLHALTLEGRKLLIDREPQDSELRRLLTALIFLVEQSLSTIKDLPDSLDSLTLGWIAHRPEIEAEVLLNFIGELIWYRDPQGDHWLRLLEAWQKVGSEQLRPSLRETAERLRVQSAITEPGGRYALPTEPPEAFAPDARELYRLWRALLECDFTTVNAIHGRVLPRTSFDTRLARILFDLQHMLRTAAGKFGDPQDVGLTRRKVQTNLERKEAVPLARDTLFAEEYAENLRRGGKEATASSRLHCFRLAMLKEIFALRVWDFSEWRSALIDQANAIFEVLRTPSCPPQFAASAIRLAVQGQAFEEKDALVKNAIALLDRNTNEERSGLVRQLLRTNLLQGYDVMEALTMISDGIPVDMLPAVADWSVRYVCDMVEPLKKIRGCRSDPLALWGDILPAVEDAALLSNRLYPAFLKEADQPVAWMDEGGSAFDAFLRNATVEHATEVIERMLLATNVNQQFFHMARWSLIYDALERRADLRQPRLLQMLRELLGAPHIAELPVFPHYIQRLEAGTPNDRPVADPQFARWLRERVQRLSATRDDQPFSRQWFGLVEWTEDDAAMVGQMIRGVDETDRSCSNISAFLGDLAGVAKTGNPSLNAQIAGALSRWLVVPPMGSNRNQLSPFSIVRITEPDQRHVLEALAFLASTILLKGTTTELLPAIHQWLRAITFEPPPPAAPLLAYIAFRCSLFDEGSAAMELISAGREVAQFAFAHAEESPEWRTTLCGVLWKLCALIEETMDKESPVWGALNKPAANGMLQMLQWAAPRLVSSRFAGLRIAAARVGCALTAAGFSTPEVVTALKSLSVDARARVRRYARQYP